MPTKGNVRRITSKTPYNKSNKAAKKGKHERAKKAENFASGSARNSASLSLSVSPYSFVAACACLGEAQPSPLVYDKHTPRCHFTKSY